MIKPIQPILIILAVTTAAIFYRKLRSRTLDRAVILLATLIGCLLVSFPKLSQVLAHALGVGRGVDLVFYIGFVVLGFLWLETTSRLRRIEQSLTDLTRAIALGEAAPPEEDLERSADRSSAAHDH